MLWEIGCVRLRPASLDDSPEASSKRKKALRNESAGPFLWTAGVQPAVLKRYSVVWR